MERLNKKKMRGGMKRNKNPQQLYREELKKWDDKIDKLPKELKQKVGDYAYEFSKINEGQRDKQNKRLYNLMMTRGYK